jgi:hypothetical protein
LFEWWVCAAAKGDNYLISFADEVERKGGGSAGTTAEVPLFGTKPSTEWCFALLNGVAWAKQTVG